MKTCQFYLEGEVEYSGNKYLSTVVRTQKKRCTTIPVNRIEKRVIHRGVWKRKTMISLKTIDANKSKMATP